MIRSGAVIAHRLGGITPEKNRAGMPHAFGDRFGIFQRQFEMFRRDAVHQHQCLIEIRGGDQRAAGFERPILQGLGTFGVAGHAILRGVCGYDPARLKSIAGRFSAPVFPGETIRTEMWRDGDIVSFRAHVVERDAIAINSGRAEVA